MPSGRPARPSEAGYRLDIALAVDAVSSASRPETVGATLYPAGVGLGTGGRIPSDGIPPCPVRMRTVGDAGVDVVASAR